MDDSDDKLSIDLVGDKGINKYFEIPLIDVDIECVRHKAQCLMYAIDDVIKSPSRLWNIDKIKEKIRNMRRAGLERSGEFSVENLAFKVLRRNGYLEKLSNLKHMAYDKLMSKTSDGLITVKINETVQNWKEFIKG